LPQFQQLLRKALRKFLCHALWDAKICQKIYMVTNIIPSMTRSNTAMSNEVLFLFVVRRVLADNQDILDFADGIQTKISHQG